MSGTNYTRTPNLQLYKPTYAADGEQWGNHINWNADTLDTLLGTGTGGTFLPLSGGQMSGPLNLVATGATAVRSEQDRWRNLRTPRDWGAVGDGTTDDTAAFTGMFAQLATEGGGRIYIPGSFYLAGAVTVPDGVEVFGNFTPTSMQYTWGTSYFQAPGSKLILGAGITLGRACILRNVMVIANNLPRSNPTTSTAANALIAQMATNGTGIALSKDNCLLDSVQVMGFNYGIYGYGDPNCDRHMLRNIHGDNVNSIYLGGSGDMCHIIGAHIWPYLTAGAGPGQNNRNTGIWVKSFNCNVQIEQCTAFACTTGYLVDGTSATFSQCWADYGTAGFASTGACGPMELSACVSVACQYGVHHSPSNGAVCEIDASCSIQGGGPTSGNTPSTGMTCAVLADGHGPVVSIGANYGGGQCAFWLGANSGPSIIIGNTFDDAGSNWDHIWNVDPAVLPVMAKHSNRVINSSRGLTEQTIGTVAQGGVAVYDQMPQGLNRTPIGASIPSTGAFTNIAASGSVSGAGFASLLSPYALSTSVPGASSTTPVMDGTAAVGTGTTWARADHVHPTDTSRAPLSAPVFTGWSTFSGNVDLDGKTFINSSVNNGADLNKWDFETLGGGTGQLAGFAWNDAVSAATQWLGVTRTGYVPQVITLTAPSIVHAGATVISASGGPTIRAGTGAATGTQPKGSIWLRTDGAAGSTLYVTQGGGTWAAVAGV